MKKIEALIRKEKFQSVDEALKKIGVGGLTYFDVSGRGRAKGEEMVSDRGTRTYIPEFIDRIKVEVLVKDSDSQKVIDAIMNSATTGAIGDGKLYVYSVDRVYDIASLQDGESAI
ncbi:MAG: P-II family nitrogen regulator [Nitrososphaerales archaeon]